MEKRSEHFASTSAQADRSDDVVAPHYTPVKLADIFVYADGIRDLHQADVSERASVCGMTREKAIAYARAAYGEDAAIENDETREVEEV
jgi:hypothetical protein